VRQVHEAFELLSDRSNRRVCPKPIHPNGIAESITQAYDVEMNIPVDYNKKWAHLDEEQQIRMRDRDEWARRAEERHQERMRVRKEEMRLARAAIRQMERQAAEQAAMVKKMLEQLSAAIPNLDMDGYRLSGAHLLCIRFPPLIGYMGPNLNLPNEDGHARR
jgi:hypothetical protein